MPDIYHAFFCLVISSLAVFISLWDPSSHWPSSIVTYYYFFQLWGSIITITFHSMSWGVKATQPCFKRTTKQSLNKITNKNICQTFPVIKSLPFSCCRMLSTGDSLLCLARNTALPKRRVRLREYRANLSFISVQLTMNDNPAIHLR